MAENKFSSERRSSWTSTRNLKDPEYAARGNRTHHGPKVLVKREINLNPFRNDACNSLGDEVSNESGGISISSHSASSCDPNVLYPKKESKGTIDYVCKEDNDLQQKTVKGVRLPDLNYQEESSTGPFIMSMTAQKFFAVLKKKLVFICNTDSGNPYSVTIPQVICSLITHPDLNPVQQTFYAILSRYTTIQTNGISLIADEDVAEVVVEVLKAFPDDVSIHKKTMDAISRLSGSNGVKIVSLATEFLQRFPNDQVIQLNFPPYLKKGIIIILKNDTSTDINLEKKLNLKINRLINVDYSNYDCLKQVGIDCIGSCLKDTIILKRAYNILKEKRFDYIIDIYRHNLDNTNAVEDFCSYVTKMDHSEIDIFADANGFTLLLDILKMYIDNNPLEYSALEATNVFVSKKKPTNNLFAANAYELILRKISKKSWSEKLKVIGCDILSSLGIKNSPEESEVLKTISKVMNENPENMNLQANAFSVLSEVEQTHNVLAVMRILEETMREKIDNTRFISITLSTFATMTSTLNHLDVFVQQVAVNDILAAQWRYSDNIKIQESCCLILANLLKYKKIEKKHAAKTINCILEVMRKFPNDVSSQKATFVALSNFSVEFLDELLMNDVTGLVIMGMVTHTDVPKIQEVGCTILANLGPLTDISEFGGIECILVAMAKHSDKRYVQSAACVALGVLYEKRNRNAIENSSVIQPMLEASKTSFPKECTDVVNKIMKTIEGQETTTGFPHGLTKKKVSVYDYIDSEEIAMAPLYIFAQKRWINYSHKVIVLGAEELIRRAVIKQLFSDKQSECFRLTKERDKLGVMDYIWFPDKSLNHTDTELVLNILNFTPNVSPRLYFSQQATYVLIWDISKTFDLDIDSQNKDPVDNVSHFINEKGSNAQKNGSLDYSIDENVIFWIDLIHKLMPNSKIYCLGVGGASGDREADRQKCHIVRMRFEELNFGRMTNENASRPNVLFEVGGHSAIHFDQKDSHLIPALRNRILIAAHNQQEADVFVSDTVTQLGARHLINAVKQMGREEIMMKWRHLLSSIRQKLLGVDSAMDVALHIMLSCGDIRTFQVSLTEGIKEEVVLLDNEWLLETVRCIVQDGYDDLKLSIEETKEDLCIYNWEEHEFCQLCVHCPVISSEESQLLWQSTEGIVDEKKNTTLAIRCLEQILVRMGILVPLGASNTSLSKLFFIPSLVEDGEPPGWSFKSSNQKIVLCNIWAIAGALTPNLMKEIIASVLRDISNEIEKSKFCNEAPIWATLAREINQDDSMSLVVHEICCWKTSILLKVEIETLEKEWNKIDRGMVEILIHLSTKDSPLCLGANHLNKGERRLSVSCKGFSKYANGPGTFVYDLVLRSVEKVLQRHPKSYQRREVVCPDCMEDYPLAEASVLAWNSISFIDRGITKCCKGHRIGVVIYR